MSHDLLELVELKKHFEIRGGMLRRVTGYVKAVDGVSFTVRSGETFGLVGESGCGKTTIGRTVIRATTPTGGEIRYRPDGEASHDIASMDVRELRPIRRTMQMIFQDPFSSLSPRMTVRDIVAEPLTIQGFRHGPRLDERVEEALYEVGLNPQYMNRYPHAFSGGQRQRIGIARAIMTRPRFIVADEPVSSLDVSVQAQILELLLRLKGELNLSYLFISHDLAVVKYLCDRVAVMYVGKIVEVADKYDLFLHPKHPYTAALMAAIPMPDPRKRDTVVSLEGEVPDPANPPSGCYFHPRCKYAQNICRTERPELRALPGSGERPHLAACHFAEKLALHAQP
jgi:peptide/nickel transport system ATP-binding protein